MSATTFVDADELLARNEELLQDVDDSPQAGDAKRARKRFKEEIAVCTHYLRGWGCSIGVVDSKLTRQQQHTNAASDEHDEMMRAVVLCYSSALDGLGRSLDAVTLLESYLVTDDGNDVKKSKQNIPVMLALAKLHFKEQHHVKANNMCTPVHTYIRDDIATLSDWCTLEDASDAFHLAGWVCIHADDHTSAYKIWKEGSELLPGCPILKTQANKRNCWDCKLLFENEMDTISEARGTRVFDRVKDLDAFSVPPRLRGQCPALSLFDNTTQTNQLVFRTKEPILSDLECTRILQQVHEFHAEPPRNGQWNTVRHSSVKTTDVAVEDIPTLRPWLRSLLAERLYPLLRSAFPVQADGSTLGLHGHRMRVHDAFIVRYDAEHDMSLSLPEHSDTSLVSFTVALNQRDEDFVGGGTWFEAIADNDSTTTRTGTVIDADRGHAVAFSGPLRHAGYPVTQGCRIILVLFLYAEDFAYGTYLSQYKEQHGRPSCSEEPKCCADTAADNTIGRTRPSGDQPGGFVVYNQTVELVSMLNRRVPSILDP